MSLWGRGGFFDSMRSWASRGGEDRRPARVLWTARKRHVAQEHAGRLARLAQPGAPEASHTTRITAAAMSRSRLTTFTPALSRRPAKGFLGGLRMRSMSKMWATPLGPSDLNIRPSPRNRQSSQATSTSPRCHRYPGTHPRQDGAEASSPTVMPNALERHLPDAPLQLEPAGRVQPLLAVPDHGTRANRPKPDSGVVRL